MTNDGQNTIVYDGENRPVSATVTGSSSGTYTYDGNGLRVKKVSVIGSNTTTTAYVFSGSKVMAEYDNGAAVGSPSREYIYSGAVLLAKIESGATKYYHSDHLSNRLVTDSSGKTVAQLGHYPFGESWYNTSSDKLLFTSYERDSESGNDYAMTRSAVNRLARFSSPDPLSGSIGNPQSLNQFSYVLNDSTNLIDPLGLCAPGADDCMTVTADPTGGGGGGGGGRGSGGVGGGGGDDAPSLIFKGGGGGGGIPLQALIPTQGPPAPPGYEECKAALDAAHKNFAAVERAQNDTDLIRAAGAANGVDPNLIAAIGVRESGWKNIPQGGDGLGMGHMQIDLGQHPDMAGLAAYPSQNIFYGAGLLAHNYNTFERRFGGDPDTLTAYAIRAYNGGPITQFVRGVAGVGVLEPNSAIDFGTTLNNYVTNVLGLRTASASDLDATRTLWSVAYGTRTKDSYSQATSGSYCMAPRVVLLVSFVLFFLSSTGLAKTRLYCYQELRGAESSIGVGGGTVRVNGFTIEVKPRTDREAAACRATIRSPRGQTIFELEDWGIEIDPITGEDVNGDGQPDVVLASFSGGAHCCWKYHIISLGQSPGVLRDFENSSKASFKDLKGDGRIEILIRDGTFDEKFHLGHPYSPFPLLIVRLRGDEFENVGDGFWGEFEKEILEQRRGLKASDLRQFLNSNLTEAHDAESYLETESRILKIVLGYLYAGRSEQARNTLSELWPADFRQKTWEEILHGYCTGLRAQLHLASSTVCHNN